MRPRVKVIDRGWKRIQREMKNIDKSHVNVGVISGGGEKGYSAHRDVPSKRKGSGKSSEIDIARLAAVHEFGVPSKRIASRPFVKMAFLRFKPAIFRKTESLLKKIYKRMTVADALEELGLFHQRNTRKIFTEGIFRANKPGTIKRKKSSRPLIDTGRLRQSIDYEVKLK